MWKFFVMLTGATAKKIFDSIGIRKRIVDRSIGKLSLDIATAGGNRLSTIVLRLPTVDQQVTC